MALFGEIPSDQEVFVGGGAGISSVWRFSTNTTMADPSSGNFRYNNATPASVTAIAISDVSQAGTDVNNVLAALGAGDRLYIQTETDASQFHIWDITSTVDNTTWWQINVTPIANGTLHTNNIKCIIGAIFA